MADLSWAEIEGFAEKLHNQYAWAENFMAVIKQIRPAMQNVAETESRRDAAQAEYDRVVQDIARAEVELQALHAQHDAERAQLAAEVEAAKAQHRDDLAAHKYAIDAQHAALDQRKDELDRELEGYAFEAEQKKQGHAADLQELERRTAAAQDFLSRLKGV